jgi:hypothetical protein
VARPSKYREEYAEQTFKLCLLGATDAELAGFFGVSESTINNWKQDHPGFLESLRGGKVEANARVAHALYEKAVGGDTTAMIFWLKNRRSDVWRDKHNVEHAGDGGGPVEVTITHRVVDPRADSD